MYEKVLEQGGGVLRLAPTWVPREFCIPGRRIKLHPDDYYAFGAHRGGIDERWLSSTTKADNGPLTTPDEGLSYVVYGQDGSPQKALLKDVVDDLGGELLGDSLWDTYHAWPMYSKFFDNQDALPLHLHQMAEHAANVGAESKPEGYYFPTQLNNHRGAFPYTFFGLEPGSTKDEIRHCLEIWDKGDNYITDLSKAYRLCPGTGWYVPPGLLHAPGSLCTYEPQWASDVFAMFQSLVSDVPIERELLVKDVPGDKKGDLDYLVSMIDWETNTNPRLKEAHYREPVPAKPIEEMRSDGYIEKWIVYGNDYVSAKELTVLPGCTVTVQDRAPYGLIMLEGHGSLGKWPLETPTLIRFGQLTYDEYFVSYPAATGGVLITNPSSSDPIVMLKHFGPNVEAP